VIFDTQIKPKKQHGLWPIYDETQHV